MSNKTYETHIEYVGASLLENLNGTDHAKSLVVLDVIVLLQDPALKSPILLFLLLRGPLLFGIRRFKSNCFWELLSIELCYNT